MRKTLIGKVVSTKMKNSAVVSVEVPKNDPVYKKKIRNTKRFISENKILAKVGDMVKIAETRPLSARKNWIIEEVVSK